MMESFSLIDLVSEAELEAEIERIDNELTALAERRRLVGQMLEAKTKAQAQPQTTEPQITYN